MHRRRLAQGGWENVYFLCYGYARYTQTVSTVDLTSEGVHIFTNVAMTLSKCSVLVIESLFYVYKGYIVYVCYPCVHCTQSFHIKSCWLMIHIVINIYVSCSFAYRLTCVYGFS